jgi:hypothetical protein
MFRVSVSAAPRDRPAGGHRVCPLAAAKPGRRLSRRATIRKAPWPCAGRRSPSTGGWSDGWIVALRRPDLPLMRASAAPRQGSYLASAATLGAARFSLRRGLFETPCRDLGPPRLPCIVQGCGSWKRGWFVRRSAMWLPTLACRRAYLAEAWVPRYLVRLLPGRWSRWPQPGQRHTRLGCGRLTRSGALLGACRLVTGFISKEGPSRPAASPEAPFVPPSRSGLAG